MTEAAGQDRTALLARARELLAANDAPGVVAILSALPDTELVAEPELGYLLANALRRTGKSGRAVHLVRALAGPCERRGHDRLWRERLNLEAAIAFDAGALDTALAAWADVVDVSTAADDADLIRRAHNNLGVVHTLLGQWDSALAHYGRALAVARRLGDARGMAEAHQNLAMAYRELDFVREADAHFRSAIELGRSTGSDDIVGRAESERALAFLFAGDPKRARASAERALDRFRRSREPLGEGEAERVLGVIALRERHVDEARTHLDRALRCAQQIGAALLEAETLEAFAALAGRTADTVAAAEFATLADQLFDKMRATAWGRQIRRRMRELAAS
jgi:tetratricopeptide (TPR) repeat protein